MNREIKFRAKRIDNNKWAYGGLIQANDFCIIDQHNELYIERDYNFRGDTHFFRLSGVMCDENTIGQFTGLHDADGKEIYEGDIITWLNHRMDGKGFLEQGRVEWRLEENAYVVVNKFKTRDNREIIHNLLRCTKDIRVRGNVHDNPELLKVNSAGNI